MKSNLEFPIPTVCIIDFLDFQNYTFFQSTNQILITDTGDAKVQVVDVVCEAGGTWSEVIARNAIQLVWEGEAFASRRCLKKKIHRFFLAAQSQPLVSNMLT